MALRRCWRLSAVVPRLLLSRTGLPGASVPGGRSSVSSLHSSHPGWRSECYPLCYMKVFTAWVALCHGFKVSTTCMFVCVFWFSAAELQLRGFSSGPPSTDVSYEELKQVLAGRKSVVIDVREPWELREYGFIPGSINVPRECGST